MSLVPPLSLYFTGSCVSKKVAVQITGYMTAFMFNNLQDESPV